MKTTSEVENLSEMLYLIAIIVFAPHAIILCVFTFQFFFGDKFTLRFLRIWMGMIFVCSILLMIIAAISFSRLNAQY